MMEKLFRLTENNTTAQREVLSGLTTFLTMMYILFANSSILSETGMPAHGVFVATALSAAVCTMIVALYANLPFAMAPGMGLNSVFAYTICMGMGYHWKEALAITFLAGVVHVVIISTSLRKAFVNAIPEHLRVGSGVGIGLFVAYVGVKNAGFLVFTSPSGRYEQLISGIIISDSSAVPSFDGAITSTQMVAIIGLVIMVILTALEKKTGDRYAALPFGIIAATFIGIPLNVTRLGGVPSGDVASAIEGFKQVFLSFFGRPGLLSIFADPVIIARTLLMILIVSMTNMLDSVGSVIGIGQVHNAKLFDKADIEKFARKGATSKLDRSLIANSVGNVISPVFGSSTSTIYMESVTGIVSGGRTGLTGLVVGILFLLCLPMVAFFQIIPGEAVAPALILAGASMLTRMRHIDWRNFEESFPAFVTILFMPIAYSILDGIAIGVLSHVVIQAAMGKHRSVRPALFIISAAYITIKLSETFIIS